MKSQKVFTLPNILCMARIAFTPIIGYLVIDSQFTFDISATLGFTDRILKTGLQLATCATTFSSGIVI